MRPISYITLISKRATDIKILLALLSLITLLLVFRKEYPARCETILCVRAYIRRLSFAGRTRRRSPRSRQFCDRRGIGFSRPSAQHRAKRKCVGRTGGPPKSPETTRSSDRASLLPRTTSPTWQCQPLTRSRTLITPIILLETVVETTAGRNISAYRRSRVEQRPRSHDSRISCDYSGGSALVVDICITFPKYVFFVFLDGNKCKSRQGCARAGSYIRATVNVGEETIRETSARDDGSIVMLGGTLDN